jgi:dihydroflavonol-4-reductase
VRALVLGAAGFLGLNLVDRLLLEGITPLCARRRRTNVLALRARRLPMVEVELSDRGALLGVMAGIDVVFHCAGHYPRLSLDRDAAIATGVRELEHVLSAARAAAVRRLIYVSSTATVAPPRPGRRASDEADRFPAPPGFGTYHDLKWRMEELALSFHGVEVSVVCPGACLGPWDLKVGTSALLIATARGLDPPCPDGIVNLVDARDVAEALFRIAETPRPPKRVLLCGANLSLAPLLAALAHRYGAPPPRPPILAAEAIRLAEAEEERAALGGPRPALSREIVDLIVHGVPIDARLAEATLGMRWTPLSQTLDAFDDWARRMHLIPGASLEPMEALS